METLPALGDVRLFLTVARLGGFSAAARELGISPGAVSKQIARLERAFDASLFERNTRHVALTPEGRKIAVHAREALRELEQAAEVAAGRRDALSGVVRLSAPTSFGRKHVTRAIAGFHAENPDVDFELHLADRPADLLVNGFDLALAFANTSVPDANVVARRLASSRRVLAAAPAYLERHGVPRVLTDLKAHATLVELAAGAATGSWPLTNERRRARVAVAAQAARGSARARAAGLGRRRFGAARRSPARRTATATSRDVHGLREGALGGRRGVGSRDLGLRHERVERLPEAPA